MFLLLLSIVGVCVAWEEIKVVQPAELANEFSQGINHRPATFGVPSYTTSITGNVLYATEGDDRDGCDELDPTDWPIGQPFIVMVDRGNCTFVSKVRNVQNARGSAVLIVDNVDEGVLPFMGDDGTGADITIPSLLISRQDGQSIKEAITNSGFVTLQITWGLPHPDGRVEWTLWTSSNDPASREMKQTWGAVVESLGLSAQFSPRYIIMDGEESGCTTDGLPCGNQCIMDGRFCAVDPDHNFLEGVSGADIVSENLRQLCLFDVLNSTGGMEAFQETLKWWEYSSLFIDECCQPEDHVTGVCTHGGLWEDCSLDLMNTLLTSDQLISVAECVQNRGEEMLQAELDFRAAAGIIFLPTVVVNNAPYRGSLTCSSPIHTYSCGPLEAICVGFKSGTEPATCLGDIGCSFGEFYDCSNVCSGTAKVDICGTCGQPESSSFNLSCSGCDGVPYSGIVNDACGVCGGDGSFDSCGRCWPANDVRRIDDAETCAATLNATSQLARANMNLTFMAAIISGVALVIIVIACVWAKRQQDQLQDINAVLAQYMPMPDRDAQKMAQNEDSETASMLSAQ